MKILLSSTLDKLFASRIVLGSVYTRVFVSGRKSSLDELISALVTSLLLFTWIWGGMTSSRDELISVPGNLIAAIYMDLGQDELIPG